MCKSLFQKYLDQLEPRYSAAALRNYCAPTRYSKRSGYPLFNFNFLQPLSSQHHLSSRQSTNEFIRRLPEPIADVLIRISSPISPGPNWSLRSYCRILLIFISTLDLFYFSKTDRSPLSFSNVYASHDKTIYCVDKLVSDQFDTSCLYEWQCS